MPEPISPTRRAAWGTFFIPFLACLILACMPVLHVRGQQAPSTQPTVVKIGVLNYRGAEEARRTWQPTADYLGKSVPRFRFELIPLDWQAISRAADDRQMDFVITNPSSYVELEVRYGATRIATRQLLRNGRLISSYGAIVIVRADRPDLQKLTDLRSRTLLVADSRSFGGWWMVWREFIDHDIDPTRQLSVKVAAEGTQDAVVYGVQNRLADAGAVRSDQLEQMQAEGKLNPADFRIINLQPATHSFPFASSTRIYPEWAFAAMSHVPEDLSREVTVALLRMPTADPSGPNSQAAGWTAPMNYAPVHDCLKALRLEPYQDYGRLTLRQAFDHYGPGLLGGAAVIMLLATLYVLGSNRRLQHLRGNLQAELAQRSRAEQSLRLGESRLQSLLQLSEMHDAPLQDITSFAMEQGVRLTESTVGYLAFLNDDETVLTMHAWSASAMKECAISDKPMVYPVNSTGLWGEPVRQRKPVITNDYPASDPLKKGYPAGHLPLTRHMNIPVFDGQKIVAVAGVGNKPTAYNESDVTQLRLIMDGMWRLMQRKRSAEAIQQMNHQLEQRVRDRTAQFEQANVELQRLNADLRQLTESQEQAIRSERAALHSLKQAQDILVQTEKLAALGQLVAGVAHEINNPLSFVLNNVVVLQRDIAAIAQTFKLYAQSDNLLAAHMPALRLQIADLCQRADLAYASGNVQDVLVRSREGLRRIQQIVKDLRDFARIDETDLHQVDLNPGIESTVNIVRGQARRKHADITMELSPLPPLLCQAARINQVIMNLLVNAIDACSEGGRVVIRSGADESHVRIEVIDNGSGIDPAVRSRIFDPFFTTKPPGEGTGLGLSISYGIIRDHGGAIDVESEPGKGTRFIVRIPLAAK